MLPSQLAYEVTSGFQFVYLFKFRFFPFSLPAVFSPSLATLPPVPGSTAPRLPARSLPSTPSCSTVLHPMDSLLVPDIAPAPGNLPSPADPRPHASLLRVPRFPNPSPGNSTTLDGPLSVVCKSTSSIKCLRAKTSLSVCSRSFWVSPAVHKILSSFSRVYNNSNLNSTLFIIGNILQVFLFFIIYFRFYPFFSQFGSQSHPYFFNYPPMLLRSTTYTSSLAAPDPESDTSSQSRILSSV